VKARRRISAVPTGHGRILWPVLFLLVLVPTACVLWLTSAAVRNARLAVRQRLEQAYRGQLVMARDRLDERFRKKRDVLAGFEPKMSGRAVFYECIRSGLADGAVCYDAQGHVVYPDALPHAPQRGSERDARWQKAERLEFAEGKPSEAAKVYASVAAEASDADEAAGTLLARARCLARTRDTSEAIRILSRTLSEKRFARATDPQGRLIMADALARAIELSADRSGRPCRAMARRLADRLNDYRAPGLPAGQRRFLMQKLESLLPCAVQFPTLAAEELAADFIELDNKPADGEELSRTKLPATWQLVSPDRRVVALFRTGTIRSELRAALGQQTAADGVVFDLLPPGEELGPGVVSSVAAGSGVPGWQLAVSLEDRSGFDSAAQAQVAAYVWTAILVILATAVLAGLIGRSFQRQMRLARLKNDLVATVSHELKTPLASMRVLVDTLLDDRRLDEVKTREYLRLVAKENLRLSRLIDNFLTFSRMERNRHAFEPRPTEVAEVIDQVIETLGERFESPGCRFEIRLEPGLPPIMADRDAMVTAVLNLLDNAYKYTGDQKHIALRVHVDDGAVCFEVTDNGIGLSGAAARRIFKRFYQVDQRLSRAVGGCGLGLSIVKFIAAEHGGSVRLSSRPGRGSTFTLAVPVVTGATQEVQEGSRRPDQNEQQDDK